MKCPYHVYDCFCDQLHKDSDPYKPSSKKSPAEINAIMLEPTPYCGPESGDDQ